MHPNILAVESFVNRTGYNNVVSNQAQRFHADRLRQKGLGVEESESLVEVA